MTGKHTPGPWESRPHWADEDMREVAPLYDGPPDIGEWSAIAEVRGHGDDEEEQAEANACLIAAAPCLLGTVRALMDEMKGYNVTGGRAYADARAVIAKATGESA